MSELDPVTAPRAALRAGFLSVVPLLLGVIPFAVIVGVTATLGDGYTTVQGWSTSVLMFAGASQLALMDLVTTGSTVVVAVITALVINARFAMYSAALGSHFRDFPPLWRVAGSYVMTDQAFVVSIARFEDLIDPLLKRYFYFGAAMTLWIVWQAGTLVGVFAGAIIPEGWQLDFTVPLVFLALLIPAIRRRADLVAALVGGTVALAGSGLPFNSGLLAGTLLGVVAGVITLRRSR